MSRRTNMAVEVQPGSPSVKRVPTVAVIGSKRITVTRTSGTSEPTFEEDVHVRAETMTVVLSKILEQPAGVRHWGINE